MAKSIEVTLKLNDKDFVRGIKNANTQLDKLQRNMKQTGAGAKSAGGAQGMGGLTTAIAAVGAATVATTGQQGAQVRLSRKLVEEVQKTANRFKTLRDSLKGGTIETEDNVKKGKQLYNTQQQVSRAARDLSKEQVELEKGQNNVNNGFAKSGGRMLKFIGIAALVAGAIAGITLAFRTFSSSIKVAAEFQDIETTLTNITGNAEAGAYALRLITEEATKLPFAFQELAGAAPALATISEDLGQLRENINLAADIGAQFGIGFTESASSLQRAFSAGAGAADIFREKGVLAAAGFEAGTTYSIDETIKKLKEYGTFIKGAANSLNNTFSGAVSQAGDRITLFNAAIGSETLPFFTATLKALVKIFDDNNESAYTLAQTIGENVISAFITFGRVVAVLIGFVDGIVSRIKILDSIFKDMGLTLPTVAAGIFIVVGAIKAFTVATNILSAAQIFLQSILAGPLGIAKVGAGIAAAAATAAALGVAFDKAGEKFTNSDLKDGDGKLITFNSFIEEVKTASEELKKLKKTGKGITDATKIPKSPGADEDDDSGKGTITAFQKLREEIELSKGALGDYEPFLLRLNELYKTDAIGINDFRNTLRDLDEQFMKNEGLNNFLETLGTAQKALSEDLTTAFLEGQSAGEAFKGFFKTLIKQIIADILRLMIIQPILAAILGPAYGFTTGGSIAAMPKVPGLAKGGPVMGNRPYVVGEQGPELFVPGSSGTIIPNGQMGGGTQVTYNINAVDSQSFQMALAKDPSFVFAVTEAGRRKQPGRI